MNYSKGISWIDDCRIPFTNEVSIKISGDKKHLQKWKERDGRTSRNIDEIENTPYENTKGRFPANLLCSDDVLNDGCISNGNKPSKRNKNHRYSMDYGLKVFEGMDITGYSDKGTNSRYYDIDKWFNELLYNI